MEELLHIARTSKYLVDENSQELLLADDGYQIMMEWERPYMAALVNKLQPFGDVLEIGFGLGYSANEIQKRGIKSHTIIESDKGIYEVAHNWAQQQATPTQAIFGRWQDLLPTLGHYNSIFFDDSPEDNNLVKRSVEIGQFLLRSVLCHSFVGSRIVWYLDRAPMVCVPPFVRYELTTYEIRVPANARYVTHQRDAMFLPLIEVLETKKSSQPYFVIDYNYQIRELRE